ncbi:unnamed protein product [Leuciscus chuanchicus]
MTAIDVGCKLACVLIKLHPREWRQTERQWGGAEGVLLSLLTLFNLNGHAQRSTLFEREDPAARRSVRVVHVEKRTGYDPLLCFKALALHRLLSRAMQSGEFSHTDCGAAAREMPHAVKSCSFVCGAGCFLNCDWWKGSNSRKRLQNPPYESTEKDVLAQSVVD